MVRYWGWAEVRSEMSGGEEMASEKKPEVERVVFVEPADYSNG